jgi:hypothetical protein
VNVYDVREPCTYPPLCYDLSPIGKYLNLPATRRKLGVGDRQWQACSGAVCLTTLPRSRACVVQVLTCWLLAGLCAVRVKGL